MLFWTHYPWSSWWLYGNTSCKLAITYCLYSIDATQILNPWQLFSVATTLAVVILNLDYSKQQSVQGCRFMSDIYFSIDATFSMVFYQCTGIHVRTAQKILRPSYIDHGITSTLDDGVCTVFYQCAWRISSMRGKLQQAVHSQISGLISENLPFKLKHKKWNTKEQKEN